MLTRQPINPHANVPASQVQGQALARAQARRHGGPYNSLYLPACVFIRTCWGAAVERWKDTRLLAVGPAARQMPEPEPETPYFNEGCQA